MQTQTADAQQTIREGKEYVGVLGAKGGVTLPLEVRQFLQVKPHDKVIFRILGQRVELIPATVMSLEEAAGSLPPLPPGKSFEEAIHEAKEEKAEKFLTKQQVPPHLRSSTRATQ